MSIVDKKGLAYLKTRGSLHATKILLLMHHMKCCQKSKSSPAVLSGDGARATRFIRVQNLSMAEDYYYYVGAEITERIKRAAKFASPIL
jgi:hypothetical protein